jgi:hypothetical protein
VTTLNDQTPSQDGPEEELPLPTGTLFFMMIFLMVMAGMWLAIYFEFLGR